MEQNRTVTNHDIILHNRKQISLSGIDDCLGFDEETIHLSTKLGKLVINGVGLHIINFDTNSMFFSINSANIPFYTKKFLLNKKNTNLKCLHFFKRVEKDF